MARLIESEAEVKGVLAESKVVAVLGAHPNTERPASYVPAYMHKAGYRIIPVNPRFVGQVLFGEAVRARLDDIDEAVDIVNVFRRSEDVPAHVPEILAMSRRPKLVWLQLGIANDDVAETLVGEGIDVIQDRCMLADHRRFGL